MPKYRLVSLRCVIETGEQTALDALSSARHLWQQQQRPAENIIYGDVSGGKGLGAPDREQRDTRNWETVARFDARIPDHHPFFDDTEAILIALNALVVLFRDKLPRDNWNGEQFRYNEVFIGEEIIHSSRSRHQ